MAIWDALIQVKAQLVFWWGDRVQGSLYEREGEQLRSWKEGISIGTDNIVVLILSNVFNFQAGSRNNGFSASSQTVLLNRPSPKVIVSCLNIPKIWGIRRARPFLQLHFKVALFVLLGGPKMYAADFDRQLSWRRQVAQPRRGRGGIGNAWRLRDRDMLGALTLEPVCRAGIAGKLFCISVTFFLNEHEKLIQHVLSRVSGTE